jgi:hypothetical protein
MNSVLNIVEDVLVDNTIAGLEYHSYLPYVGTSYGRNDEIRIPLQQTDVYTLPSDSYLYFEGEISNTAAAGTVPTTLKLVNNFICHLFDEIRYEINGQIIDRVRNPGITVTLKNLVSLSKSESVRLFNAGWSIDNSSTYSLDKNKFNICIPLSMLLGIFEDYRKILINLKQELVLLRTSNDTNAIIESSGVNTTEIKISKVIWKVPHVIVNDQIRLKLLSIVDKGVDINVPFRSWELHELPSVPSSTKNSWTIKSATQLEKPRYIIFALQTKRRGELKQNCSQFDHCKFVNAKLFLNAQQYPYDNMQINFEDQQYATLYEMYSRFQPTFYNKTAEPLLDKSTFEKEAPIIVIDCLHPNDDLNIGSVDIRLEFETSENVPANTTAYCLIIHDQLFTYNALRG